MVIHFISIGQGVVPLPERYYSRIIKITYIQGITMSRLFQPMNREIITSLFTLLISVNFQAVRTEGGEPPVNLTVYAC